MVDGARFYLLDDCRVSVRVKEKLMPIAYGQCKGRKYNNQQPLPEKPKQPKKARKVVSFIKCPECGLEKPPMLFRKDSSKKSGYKKICSACEKKNRGGRLGI